MAEPAAPASARWRAPPDITVTEKWDQHMTNLCRRTIFPENGDRNGKVPDPQCINPDGFSPTVYMCREIEIYAKPDGKRKRGAAADMPEAKLLEIKPPCMRYIAQGPSVQHLGAAQRRLCTYTVVHDVDQMNSGAVILRHLAGVVRVPCPLLNDYCERRSEFLEMIHTGGFAKDVHAAKGCIAAIVYGSKQFKRSPCEFLADLTEEVGIIRRAVMTHPTSAAVRHELAKYVEVDDKATFARVIFDVERRITMIMVEAFRGMGYAIGGILHDGIHVVRKQPLRDIHADHENLPMPLLALCSERIFGELGIRMTIREKCQKPTPEDIELLRVSPRVISNALEAAMEVSMQSGAKFVHTDRGIALFDDRYNMWSLNSKRNVCELLHATLAQHVERLVKRTQNGCTYFLSDIKPRDAMYEMLASVIPRDEAWLRVAVVKSRFKLAFTNGYWDFLAGHFVRGVFPEEYFLSSVHDELADRDEEQVTRANDFLRQAFSRVDVYDFYMKAIARAIAGDVASKRAYLVIGPSNSGKSTSTTGFINAFKGLANQFDASNLCGVTHSDRGRNFAWVAPIAECRLAISNEIDFRGVNGREQKINTVTWKRLVSGGEDEVFLRLLYKEETPTMMQVTIMIQCNDVPEFDVVDTAVINRTFVINQDRYAAPPGVEPTDPKEFKRDEDAPRYVRSPEFFNGLRHLMFDYFALFQLEGHDAPEAVRISTQERVEKTTVVDFLLDHYEMWDAAEAKNYASQLAAHQAGWSVQASNVYDKIVGAHLGISHTRVAQELAAHRPPITRYKNKGNFFIGMRGKAGPGMRN